MGLERQPSDFYVSDSLGIFSGVQQLFGFVDVLRGLVDDPLDVGEVGQPVLDLHHHLVHGGLVDGQRDGEDVERHLLDAVWICSLLCTNKTQLNDSSLSRMNLLSSFP